VVAGWQDVVAIVRESFEVVIDGDGWIGLLHRPETGSPVKVKVSMLTALARSFVAITADVFSVAELTMELALALNHALPIGALEIEDERYLLRATLPIAGLDAIDLRRVVLHIGRQAAHMQRGAGKSGLTPFLHWAE
jgi:hypothetical protein